MLRKWREVENQTIVLVRGSGKGAQRLTWFRLLGIHMKVVLGQKEIEENTRTKSFVSFEIFFGDAVIFLIFW